MIWSWWVLLLIPIAFFLQIAIHELSHLLVGWIMEGRKPLEFKPYPHMKDGEFLFGSSRMGPATRKSSTSHRHIAPFWFGLQTTLIAIGICVAVPLGGKIFIVPFILGGVWDMVWFWGTYLFGTYQSDGKRYRRVKERERALGYRWF